MDTVWFSIGMAAVLEFLKKLKKSKDGEDKAGMKKALMKLWKEIDAAVRSLYPEEFKNGDA